MCFKRSFRNTGKIFLTNLLFSYEPCHRSCYRINRETGDCGRTVYYPRVEDKQGDLTFQNVMTTKLSCTMTPQFSVSETTPNLQYEIPYKRRDQKLNVHFFLFEIYESKWRKRNFISRRTRSVTKYKTK